MSELDEWLKPGAGVPVDIRTVGILVHEIMRLRDEVALWKERCEAVQRDFDAAWIRRWND